MMHGMASNNRSQGGRPGMMRGGPMGRGGPMAMMKGEKPRDFKGTLKKLIQYLSQYRVLVLFVWLLAIGSTVASIVGPKILGKATTKLFEGVMAKIGGTGTIAGAVTFGVYDLTNHATLRGWRGTMTVVDITWGAFSCAVAAYAAARL